MLQSKTPAGSVHPHPSPTGLFFALVLFLLPCLSCAISGEGGPPLPPEDAQTVGEGICWVEVQNRTGAEIELYYWVGIGSPRGTPRSWPTAGFVPAGRTVVVRAPCEGEYVNLTAYYQAQRGREMTVTGRDRPSNTRRVVIRLRN